MKKLLLFCFLVISVFSVFAQKEDPVKREKMLKEEREFRMNYLADKMDLSELQKKRFIELYDEMMESKKDCYEEAIVMERKIRDSKDGSEEDYQQARNALNEANQKWNEIERQYDEKFSEFLSQKQIYKLHEAEAQYRATFDMMKHKRKKGPHKKHEEPK